MEVERDARAGDAGGSDDSDHRSMYVRAQNKRERGITKQAKKPTKFMTNSPCIAAELAVKCNRKHEHQALLGGRAERAAEYPEQLCKALCREIARQIKSDEWGMKRLMTVATTDKVEKGKDWDHEEGEFGGEAWDDVTGSALNSKEVRKARLKEASYVEDKGVWEKITRQEAARRGWKVIGARWIDVNKGGEDNWNYRSRLVAKEYNDGEAGGLFAATPPLEGLKMIISSAAQVGEGGREDEGKEKVIMISDVARAFFEAPMKRDVCVELPQEAKTEEDEKEDKVGWLYGTRDAVGTHQGV